MVRTPAILAVLILFSGCDLVTGVQEERALGAIGYPDNLEVAVPEAVEVDQEFTVTVRTLGADGCWARDRTEVTITGLSARVAPYDVFRRESGTACTHAPVEIIHTATLSFSQAGVAQVEITGRDGTVELSVLVEQG